MHGGDPSRHLARARADAALDDLAPAPTDRGRVSLLVVRGPGETRRTPPTVHLAPDQPVPGDRWSAERDPERAAQVTAMEAAVGLALANGQDLALFGDNLVLNLDLGEANLPVGSRVRVGGALLEVTPKPHHGCRKYAARFGVDALAAISTPERRPRRLRGLHFRVVEAGDVAVGDEAVVVSRAG